jgi:hypothetical protein
MPKKIAKDIARQLAQLGGEIFGEAKPPVEKTPSGIVGQAEVKAPRDTQLEELKQQKTIQTRRQIAQVEQEIRQIVAQRKEQKELWRKTQEEKMAKGRKLDEEKEPAPVVPSKPKRGLFGLPRRVKAGLPRRVKAGFWSRRVKTAQQQSQPERAGRRVGG